VRKYGRIYGSYDFMRKIIVVNEPDLIRDIMVKDFDIFPHHKLVHFGSTKINLNLFFLPGNEDWKRIRSIISPSFTSGKLRSMMANISDISEKFVSNLDKLVEKGMN
jgi:cytochrome P450